MTLLPVDSLRKEKPRHEDGAKFTQLGAWSFQRPPGAPTPSTASKIHRMPTNTAPPNGAKQLSQKLAGSFFSVMSAAAASETEGPDQVVDHIAQRKKDRPDQWLWQQQALTFHSSNGNPVVV